MIAYIENYLNQPEVMLKLAQMYPNATSGVPIDTPRHTDLSSAVGELASKSYFQRKEARLIRAGLLALKELDHD